MTTIGVVSCGLLGGDKMLSLNICDICKQPIAVGRKFIEVEATQSIVKADDDEQLGTGMCGYLICESHFDDDRFKHIIDGIAEVQV